VGSVGLERWGGGGGGIANSGHPGRRDIIAAHSPCVWRRWGGRLLERGDQSD